MSSRTSRPSYNPSRDKSATATDPHALLWAERGFAKPELEVNYNLPIRWLALLAVVYTPRGAVRFNEIVRHAVHGMGVVDRELDGNKIDVIFQTGRKVLVHRRRA